MFKVDGQLDHKIGQKVKQSIKQEPNNKKESAISEKITSLKKIVKERPYIFNDHNLLGNVYVEAGYF